MQTTGSPRADDRYAFGLKLALGFGANLLALWLASRLIQSVGYREFSDLAIAAAVLSVVNAIVKPVLTALGCLVIVVTLGVALFFINVAMVALAAWLVPGFTVGSFWPAVGTTLIVWAANVLVQAAAERVRKKQKRISLG